VVCGVVNAGDGVVLHAVRKRTVKRLKRNVDGFIGREVQE
jgi:hypothetical protein